MATNIISLISVMPTLAQGIHTITVRAGNEQVVKKLIIIN
jgi:hypothetical protein